MKKKEKIVQMIFISIALLIISIIGIITLTNNNETSYKEGRNLQTFPKITIRDLFTSDFYTALTSAYADQLAFREEFIKYYYLINLQRYTGDVVKGSNNELYLSPLIIKNKESYIKKLKNAISNDMNNVAKAVTDAGASFIFISIPRKDVIMEKDLPESYINGTKDYLEYVDIIKENISQNVIFVDGYDEFKKHQDECYNVYYKTDHHLNVRGGYILFNKIISIINEDKKYNINIGKLEDEYLIDSVVINGSYNRKIGQSVSVGPEEHILTPKNTQVKYVRKEDGKMSEKKVFGKGNTYADAFMGGDCAETVIYTNIKKSPSILYVGTSYTNVLEAFSVYKFGKMVSIDYRDNKTGKSIVDYVKEYDIDYVVYICAQSTNSLSVSAIKEHLGL